jgi:hypothetical protein
MTNRKVLGSSLTNTPSSIPNLIQGGYTLLSLMTKIVDSHTTPLRGYLGNDLKN